MNRRRILRSMAGLGAVGLAGCIDSSRAPGTSSERGPGSGADESGTDAGADDGTEASESGTTPSSADGTAEGTDDGSPGSSTAGTNASWPAFAVDAGNTGFRPNDDGPSAGTIAWSAIGDAPTVFCPPTVDAGVVYTGSTVDAVHAFDAESGESLWEFPTTDYVETAPAVRDGRVYTADSAGVVYALTTDGEEVWRHETGQNLHSRTVAVRDGTVYVGTAGDMPMVANGDTDASKAGTVVALHADSGEEAWSFRGPEDWFTGPALGDGRVYVGNHNGDVFALDAESGEKAWSWSASDAGADHPAILAPPTYAGGTVYAGVHAAGWLVALDAATGDLDWRTDLAAANVKSSPAVTDDRVYVGSYRVRIGEPDPPVVETSTGSSATPRSTPTTTPASTPTVTPTSAGTPTAESGTTGRLYALARDDGSEAWVHETDHDFRSSPAVVGDAVYVGGGDGALAVARDDGSERWRVTFDDFVASSPAVAAGRLFLGSADGHLYCVAPQ